MKKALIEFRDFSFRYKTQNEYTLKDINLTIYEGEKVLLLGPSGCGKSTLSNCINGLIPFSYPGEIKGSCKVAGMETSSASLFRLSGSVGTVLQDSDAQFVGLSVGEDIAYALENDNMPRPQMLPLVQNAANIVGMGDFLEHVPYNLSGGQKQRVALAGIMHGDVQVLLFDEPLAALDPSMGMFAVDLIDRIHREQKKTVLIIEHRLEDVLYRNVDRIILMEEGRVVSDTTPAELLCGNLLHTRGIREPLYITALKHAGCVIRPEDHPEDISTMNLEPYRDAIIADFEKLQPEQPKEAMEELVKVENVSFAYGRKKVLDDVSLSIYRGERIAVVGKNGAGKSTLAKLMCGIIRPKQGEVTVLGENYMSMTIREIGEKIGYVMQNPNQMIVKDIIKDEVALGLTLHNFTQEQIEERVEEALKMCNLYPMRNWPVSAVSYGQRKRITIASILAMKPEIIILDEPTAGQDYRVYTEIMTFLEELNQKYGITILFITHDMHLAIEYTDRALVFSDGKCISTDNVFKVLSDEAIIEKANLKQTSLYTLASRLGLNAQEFIRHFIETERRGRV